MQLTEKGERKRKHFSYHPEEAPEETWFRPRNFDEEVLSELGSNQPIRLVEFLVHMATNVGEDNSPRILWALNRLARKDYIEGFGPYPDEAFLSGEVW